MEGLKEPSRPTVKRLFALSSNKCAFPRCNTSLIDKQSGSVIGQICHIKGEKPESSRYDQQQTNDERHSFENLILLCGPHHKVIDDDETAYTVERLLEMKQSHESMHAGHQDVDEEESEKFTTVAISECKVEGSIFVTQGQNYGQIAHSITNVYDSSNLGNDELILDGKLTTDGLFRTKDSILPGLILTIICKGKRTARIRSACLLLENADIMEALQKGFNNNFGYTPLEGSTETYVIDLEPLSQKNHEQGFKLERDEVCKFFIPPNVAALYPFVQAKPEQVTVNIVFFDDTEFVILRGEIILAEIKALLEVFQKQGIVPKAPIRFSVRVKSTTMPDWRKAGKTNPNEINLSPFDDSAK